jgi:hypothetical protein
VLPSHRQANDLDILKLLIPPQEVTSDRERPASGLRHLNGNRMNSNIPEPLVSPHGSASSTEMPIFCLRDLATISLVKMRTWYTKADGITAWIGAIR